MSEEFDISEVHTTFDFKGFLFKLLRFWPLFLVSLVIAFSIARYINVRKLPVYQMDNLVSIKDDQNPFFTSNTSLTFNWGGTTDKVNTSVITLRSRTHNEKVVERLQFYINYQREGEYQLVDAYKQTPFFVEVDTSNAQILNKQFSVVFKDSVTFNLSAEFSAGAGSLQNYHTKEKSSKYFEAKSFSKDFRFGDKVRLPFFSGTFVPNPELAVSPGATYYFSFRNFDGVVGKYNGIGVEPLSKGSSVIRLRLVGQNKARLVDYLNASVKVLSDDMLERKNLFATKTIRFIDSSLSKKSLELKVAEDELNKFKNKSAIFDLALEGNEINDKLNGLDIRKEALDQQLSYYNVLETYLLGRSDYRNVPAPSVSGITEGSITASVAKIVTLAEERNKLQYAYKEGAPIFADIDRQIDAVKVVLLENINSSKGLKRQEQVFVNRGIAKYEKEIRKLPKEQQELLKIERRYNLSQGAYNLFLSKRSEADLVKAANVSDVLVIDPAKDIGGGQVGPNTRLNNVMATMLGFAIPFLFVFLLVFFDTKVHTINDIKRLSKIPILGVVGKSTIDGNLVVLDKSKSSIAEAFRTIRASLQFIYKKQGIEGTKTVLVTSSVSGEGKTFCSINLASVFALSEKKTILVGLDLRKPKIFGDFNLDNDIGVVNYLIQDRALNAIIQKTRLEHLDVISSGPIPPNPSELLMSDRMELLIEELKEQYDYIVLDSPPLGLVSDSLGLIKFADATIYVVRQNYTKRGMFSVINEKYKRGEVTNLSFVLNSFEDKTKNGYGYGYGYGYYDDERKPSLWVRAKRLFKRK
ncbi:MAG: capsular exopolysaccharide synthesis family protein [Flavobacteriaceae bacterium]|jgi:capsular exopolysaccharide synthesis family protein